MYTRQVTRDDCQTYSDQDGQSEKQKVRESVDVSSKTSDGANRKKELERVRTHSMYRSLSVKTRPTALTLARDRAAVQHRHAILPLLPLLPAQLPPLLPRGGRAVVVTHRHHTHAITALQGPLRGGKGCVISVNSAN